jgi:hypothetical protein
MAHHRVDPVTGAIYPGVVPLPVVAPPPPPPPAAPPVIAMRDAIARATTRANADKSLQTYITGLFETRIMDNEDICNPAGMRLWGLMRAISSKCGIAVFDATRGATRATRDSDSDNDRGGGGGDSGDSDDSNGSWVATRGGGGGGGGGGGRRGARGAAADPLRVRAAAPTFAAATAALAARAARRRAAGRTYSTQSFINPEVASLIRAGVAKLAMERPAGHITLERILSSDDTEMLFTEWVCRDLAGDLTDVYHRRRASFRGEGKSAAKAAVATKMRLLDALDGRRVGHRFGRGY